MVIEIPIYAYPYILLLFVLKNTRLCQPFFSFSMDINSQKSKRRGIMIYSLLQFCTVLKDSNFEGLMKWSFMPVGSSFMRSLVNLLNVES
ncbi:hypothetical protein Peur_070242 [Populus x canadensis]|jgi:hypothetical protein